MDELVEVLDAQGIEPAGPVFAHHLRMSMEIFDFELGVPVRDAVEPRGRVRPAELPAATVARATYRGAYEGLPSAWGAFDEWLEEHGHRPEGDAWEAYLEGPAHDPRILKLGARS